MRPVDIEFRLAHALNKKGIELIEEPSRLDITEQDFPKIFISQSSGFSVWWNPTVSMSDAWEVAERFGLTNLEITTDGRNMKNRLWKAFINTEKGFYEGIDKLAPLAICKAAIKVLEGQ